MATYRVIDAQSEVVDTSEFTDSTQAHDWFKTVKVPNDELGTALQVLDDGEWKNFDVSDGGSNPNPSADAH